MLNDSIPVVMYHHVMPGDRELNVTPELFEEQMAELKRKGWKTLSADEFLYLMENTKEKRKKCVLLTFDDGFYDNYLYAYPVLKKYKLRGVIFVITDFVRNEIKREKFVPCPHKEMWSLIFAHGRNDYLCTWKELREMSEERVFDIESHGSTHDIPYYIKQRDYAQIREDLRKSKELIHRYLSKETYHLCWPKGAYDEKALEIAVREGFRVLYTTERGVNTENLNCIKRLPVKCRGADWLLPKLKIYSSSLLSSIYLKIRIR